MKTTRVRSNWILLLLLLPFVGLLYVSSYNTAEPTFWGFPFFYWYQLLWVPITVVITWVVYGRVSHDD
jgi:cell division protein FtsW (lipid II flippase)